MAFFDNIDEQETVGFESVHSGAYVCRVTSAEFTKTKKGKPCILLLWDIAEGPFEGEFSRDWYDNKPFKHSIYVMTDGSALGLVKHIGSVIDKSTPGLRVLDALGMYIDPKETPERKGKAQDYLMKALPTAKLGIVLQERLYTYNGKDQSEVNVTRYVTVDEAKSGELEIPETLDERDHGGSTATAATTVASNDAITVADDDIPF